MKTQWNQKWIYGALAGIFVFGAFLGTLGLTHHPLWDDEANTALFAKNLLQFGELTAWDGHNLIAYKSGMELNNDLINVFMPPLQYYVAAASFQLLGISPFSARLPFLLFGLLTIIPLFFFANRMVANPKLALLACLLLVLNVQYMLFIRNCRYYALGAFFTLSLFAVMATPPKTRKGRWMGHLLASACVIALFQTSYFNALSAVLYLPIFYFLLKKPNDWVVPRLAMAWLAAVLAGVYALWVRNPFGDRLAEGREMPEDFVANTYHLIGAYLRDLGFFEMVALLLLPALLLPWVVPSLKNERVLAKKILLMLIFVPISIVIAALFGRQAWVHNNLLAEMRYVVPVIPLAALGSAISLFFLYRWWRWMSVVVLPLLVFSNALYPGFLSIDDGHLRPKGLNCTLCQYLRESLDTYPTLTEKLLRQIDTYKEPKNIIAQPMFMSYPLMFHAPSHIYTRQLKPDTLLSADKKKLLPAHHFDKSKRPIDVLIFKADRHFKEEERIDYEGYTYKKILTLRAPTLDTSRPEIPMHAFSEEEVANGHNRWFYLYERESR